MAQFALCTTCCISGCIILWKLCTIKCGQYTINNEQCKIVACEISFYITRNMQHFSTMLIVFASLLILCKCCAWCSQQFLLSALFCNCLQKVTNLCTIAQEVNLILKVNTPFKLTRQASPQLSLLWIADCTYCTLRSGLHEIPTMIRTFPHGLENNHACKWIFNKLSCGLACFVSVNGVFTFSI